MHNILVIYGTHGGNTKLVVDQVGLGLQEAGHSVVIRHADEAQWNELEAHDILVLASPTYGHGTLDSFMEAFVGQYEGDYLKNKPCTVIGLGDAKYDAHYHLESERILREFAEERGAKMLYNSLRISGNPMRFLEAFVPKWTEGLIEVLKDL